MPAKIIVMEAPKKPRSYKELFEKALDSWTTEVICDIGDSLLLARQIWRQHRDLVEAADLPEPFRSYALKQGTSIDETSTTTTT